MARQANKKKVQQGLQMPDVPSAEKPEDSDSPGVDDRSTLLEWLRSELVGPQIFDLLPKIENEPYIRTPLDLGDISKIDEHVSIDESKHTAIFHTIPDSSVKQEIIWFKRESPKQRYGSGVLYPHKVSVEEIVDLSPQHEEREQEDAALPMSDNQPLEEVRGSHNYSGKDAASDSDDLEVASRDRFRPSSMGLSVNVKLPLGTSLKLVLPNNVSFPWQKQGRCFPVNGWYTHRDLKFSRPNKDSCNESGSRNTSTSVRYPVASDNVINTISSEVLKDLKEAVLKVDIIFPDTNGLPHCPLKLQYHIYPRRQNQGDEWLVTVVLRNMSEQNN